jgi:hypothetical protein
MEGRRDKRGGKGRKEESVEGRREEKKGLGKGRKEGEIGWGKEKCRMEGIWQE